MSMTGARISCELSQGRTYFIVIHKALSYFYRTIKWSTSMDIVTAVLCQVDNHQYKVQVEFGLSRLMQP